MQPKAGQNRTNKMHDQETTIKEPDPLNDRTGTDQTRAQETIVAAWYSKQASATLKPCLLYTSDAADE